MNEQLQQALAAIITKTMQGIDSGVSFLGSELPDVIQQLLIYKAAWAGVEAVMLSVFVGLYIAFWRFYAKADNGFWKSCDDPEAPTIFFGVIGGFLSVVFVVGIIVDIQTIVQIWLAPKIYLIEYAAKLASGK